MKEIYEKMKKNYKIKLSSNKLRVLSSKSCISIDLDMFASLEIKQEKDKICFVDGDSLFSSISFSSEVEAKDAYNIISRKVMRKNKKFRTVIFLTKLFLIMLFVYLYLMFNVSLKNNQERAYKEALMQEYQQELLKVETTSSNKVESNIDKARGTAISVEDVFSVRD